SAIGLYAVVSIAVSQRTQEIGIRPALGAARGRTVRLFFTKGMALTVIDLAAGLPPSLFGVRYFAVQIGVPLPSTPLLAALAGSVVGAVAVLASWRPAQKAAYVDPLVVLRVD